MKRSGKLGIGNGGFTVLNLVGMCIWNILLYSFWYGKKRSGTFLVGSRYAGVDLTWCRYCCQGSGW